MGVTEYSIGFQTAVDTATKALDSLQSTAASHGRAMILEVMGRDAGHIALNAGIAGGADIILIPEIDYTIKGVIEKLHEIKKNKIGHSLIIVAESVKKENGTKVLNNGEVRLDANISTKVLTEFITNHTAKIITHTVRNIRRRNELELLRQRVLTEVGISTLSRGVGITEDMFEEFLRMMVNNNDSNDNKDTNYMHRKKIMENLDVRVSKYFGVSDDGYILVPWDVELKN